MPRIIINPIKLFAILPLILFSVLTSQAQVCTDDLTKNNWNNSWVSCRKSASPNPERPRSHWLLYEFDQPQSIALSYVWNANRRGESGMGIKEAIIDYSVDGTTWTTLGTYTFPKANEKASYGGFAGPDFGGIFVSKILVTAISTYGDGECASLAEMQFNVNPTACYGEVDACGVCDGNGESTWYRDADGDGLGDPDSRMQSCEPPAGFVANADDDCDTGVIGWATVGRIFEENGCTGCHGANAAGGLNLTSYATTIQGGNKCGPGILTGTTLVDIITTDSYAGCGDPFIGPSMNARAGGQIDAAELALIRKWIEDQAPEDCNCPPEVPDTDGDGVCDAIDQCPDMDNSLIGTPCDDGSDCTINDVWQDDCACRGELIDRDGDGVCDQDDLAPDDPCTADGIVDGKEPAGWVANPENDCDQDRISVARGDLDDFSACVDQNGTRSTPECNCGDKRRQAGALVTGFAGMSMNEAKAANGAPDGLFTETINYGTDTVILQFPYMETGEEICLTVGFSSGNGELRLLLNNRLMTFTGDRALDNYQPQEFCFQTFNAGVQTLVITEQGPGNVRVDGATYSTCPCTDGDIEEVTCLVNLAGMGWQELENCSLEICEGQPLTLGTDRYGSLTYQWRGPKGLAMEGSTLSFLSVKPSDSGLYWLYYRNDSGCDLIRQIELTVIPAPPVTARVRHPACGSPNGEIVLSFEDTPGRSSIEFSLDGPEGNYVQVPDNFKRYTYSNLGGGTYDVWTRWGEGDCPIQLGTYTLRDQPTPKVEVTQNQEICEGQSVLLRASSVGDNLTYRWSNGSNRARQRVTPELAGYADQTFIYRVSVTDANGCTGRGRVRVKVNARPKALVDLTHPSQGTANGAVTFHFDDHPDRRALEISLNGEGGDYQRVADNAGSYTFSDLPRGDYEAWIRWADGSGCPVGLGTLRLRPGAGCPDVKTNASERVICEGESVRLNVTRGSGWTYSWSNGAATHTQVVTPVLDGYADQTFTYSVTVTDRNGCTSTNTEKVTVRSKPQVEFDLSPAHCGQADGSITFRFKDHPDRSRLEISINGRNGKYRRIEDKKGKLTFARLKAGRYDAWVRWNDNSCPVNLGRIDLNNESAPQIDAGPDRVICEGQSVRLRVNQSKDWSYRWSNNVRKPVQTLNLKTDPYRNSVRRFAVTVTDQFGCKATDAVNVTVQSRPRATINVAQPSCGRADGAITFRFQNHRHQDRMEFSINGKNGRYRRVDDKKRSLTFSRLKAGRYDAWVRWGDDSCPVRLGRVELKDIPGPQIDAGPDRVICEGERIRLSVQNNRNWTYRWSNNVRKHSQTVSPPARPYENRVINYSVRVTDKKGCSSTDAVKVTVLSKPRVRATFTQPTCGQANGTITLRFKDHKDQRRIEFSLNGKNGKYVRRRDDAGAVTFSKLAPGRYDVWARWPGGKCPVRVQVIRLSNQGKNCPPAGLQAPVEEALPNETITAGERDSTSLPGIRQIETDQQGGAIDRPAELKVYPNPSRAGMSVTIEYFATQTGRPLRIFAPTGQLVREIDAALLVKGWNVLTVDLMHLAPGSYFVADGYGNHEVLIVID